uniref:DNA-directed DNA polymerase n=1 Tax=Panagrolaimus davidi TaxID=227884 RepID=A0A914QQW8_9BILA
MGPEYPCPQELNFTDRIICDDCDVYFLNEKPGEIDLMEETGQSHSQQTGQSHSQNISENVSQNEYYTEQEAMELTSELNNIYDKEDFMPCDDDIDLIDNDSFVAPFFHEPSSEEFNEWEDIPGKNYELEDYYYKNYTRESVEKHIVNVAGSLHRCSDCIDDIHAEKSCKYCESEPLGIKREKMWSSIPNSPDFVDFHENPIDGLRDYMIKLTELTGISRIYAYSHNGSRFDTHLLIKSFTKDGFAPKIKMKGLSIFEAELKPNGVIKKKIMLRDSYKIIPIGLRHFNKTFDLPENVYKFDFGHLFNKEENYGKVLDGLPHRECYGYSSLTKKNRAAFDIKYNAENERMQAAGEKYRLPEKITVYCRQDIRVLYQGFLAYRKILNNLVKDKVNEYKFDKIPHNADIKYYDIVTHGTTVASLSMYLFKFMFLKKDQIGLVSERGYMCQTNQSKIAIGYLDWLIKKNGNYIRHKDNHPAGEFKFGRTSVDGWDEQNKIVYQIHGCYFHACSSCFQDDSKILMDGKSVATIRSETARKLQKLEEVLTMFDEEIKLKVIYECEIRQEMEDDHDLASFVNEHEDTSPIDLRRTLAGGRTGPLVLEANMIRGQKKIRYFDIISLYPYILSCGLPFPTGHPKIYSNVDPYLTADDVPLLGIMRVKILPPENLMLPIIPIKENSQLLFVLCKKCAQEHHDDNVGKISCTHSDEERAFEVLTNSAELSYAMKNGYKCLKVYHEMVYEQGSCILFRDYIMAFLKIKVEASEPSFTDEESKREFVELYKKVYNLTIDGDKCKLNNGERYISKLFLNSLWGRFSLFASQNEKNLVTEEEFLEMLNDKTIFDLEGYKTSDKIYMVNYKKDINHVQASNVNITLSIFTTAYARLHLYKYMKKVHLTEGCEILYSDTGDYYSLFFTHPWDENPLDEDGQLLGEMLEEYRNFDILSFITGGAKVYFLELAEKEQEDVAETVIKIRGITVNNEAEEKLNKEIFEFNPEKEAKIPTMRIAPNNNFDIYTTHSSKIFRTYCKKGIIYEKKIYPFGYKFDKDNYELKLLPEDNVNIRKNV